MTELTPVILDAIKNSQPELPAGYVHADTAEMNYGELHALDESIRGPFNSPLERLSWPDLGKDIYGRTHIAVGVRTEVDLDLIGVGFLDLEGFSSGTLSNLMVHKDHRHRSIARALVTQRVALADALNVKYLSTGGDLSKENTLKPLYLELGFEPHEFQGILRRVG